MVDIDLSRVRAFKTSDEFYDWLELNHQDSSELWLQIYKKGSQQPSISWQEAVRVALCWGWIDSVKMSRDADSYLQRFTPRRAGSSWSRRNTEHVEALLEEGLMREAGMLHVRAAQADGRWASAYAPSSEMALPPDFLAELEANPAAKEFFETLSKSSRYVIYHRLQTAKQADTRQRRLEKFVALLTNREKPT